VVWHHSLLLMNSFNKTEAAVFSCRLCFLRAFPFISLICKYMYFLDVSQYYSATELYMYFHIARYRYITYNHSEYFYIDYDNHKTCNVTHVGLYKLYVTKPLKTQNISVFLVCPLIPDVCFSSTSYFNMCLKCLNDKCFT